MQVTWSSCPQNAVDGADETFNRDPEGEQVNTCIPGFCWRERERDEDEGKGYEICNWYKGVRGVHDVSLGRLRRQFEFESEVPFLRDLVHMYFLQEHLVIYV